MSICDTWLQQVGGRLLWIAGKRSTMSIGLKSGSFCTGVDSHKGTLGLFLELSDNPVSRAQDEGQ
jgi:hypothetical protein